MWKAGAQLFGESNQALCVHGEGGLETVVAQVTCREPGLGKSPVLWENGLG